MQSPNDVNSLEKSATQLDPAQMALVQQEVKRQQTQLQTRRIMKSSADWFLGIAALSVINTAILLFSGALSFILGLGYTRFIDDITQAFSKNAGPGGSPVLVGAGVVADLVIAGIFVLLGLSARKGSTSAFLGGMIFYAVDGLLFLLVGSLLGVGFHVFVLLFLYGGWRSARKLKQAIPKEQLAPLPEII